MSAPDETFFKQFEAFIQAKIDVALNKRHQDAELVPLQQFCREKNISRSTVYRAEKKDKIKLIRVGKKIFINPNALD